MQEAIIMKRWGYFFRDLQNLSNLPISDKAKVNDMKYSRGSAQAGYKQMHEEWSGGRFDGTLSDYLCLISAFYLITRFRQTASNISLANWARFVLDSYANNKIDVRNTLRLFRTNPNFFELVCGQLGCQNEIIARVKANCLLAGFLEILKNDEFNGGIPPKKMAELVSWLKKLAN
jgi:hypothetical protein